MAVSIITGERNPGRMPVEREFCMVVTSLVSLVTGDELLKWSVFAKENCCSFANSALRISAPTPWPHRAENMAEPVQAPGISGQKHHLQPLHQNIAPVAVCNPTSTMDAITRG